MNGIIIKGIGGFYYVKAVDNNVYECKARGIFRNEHITPVIGDTVVIEIKNNKGSINEILPRRNQLIRPSVSNIDILVLVVAASFPDPNKMLIDKMLINAHINNIKPVVCINKTDISDGDEIEDIYRSAGYDIYRICAKNNTGLDELRNAIKNKIAAFAGLSGVGKSSILGLITGEDIETGSVSEKIQRGKNTTRHVELFELPEGGFVLDTPGFSSLDIPDIKADELQDFFPEMSEKKEMCRFRGCSHINEPGCAVKALVDSGVMRPSRYESYVELFTQLNKIKAWEKK